MLNAAKSLLFLQLHRVTYLVNFHPKQSQKTISRFTPPLHFLGETWIAIAALPQTKTTWFLLYYLSSNYCEFILSLYSLYNSKSILVRQLNKGCGHHQLFQVAWALLHEPSRTAPIMCTGRPSTKETQASGNGEQWYNQRITKIHSCR